MPRRKCDRCQYRTHIVGYGNACGYLLITDERRGCPVEGCTRYVKGDALPSSVEYDLLYGGVTRRCSKKYTKPIRRKGTPIILTNIKTGEERRFEKIREAAEELECVQSAITKVLIGKGKTVKGHFARYADTISEESDSNADA